MTDLSHLGHTRGALRPDHLLQTPDTFVRTPLPGLTDGVAIVHTAPALHAAFTQYTAELNPGGTLTRTPLERLLYLLEGEATLAADALECPGSDVPATPARLIPGSFAYLPPGHAHTLTAVTPTRLVVIEKPYVPLPGRSAPGPRVGHRDSLTPTFLNGDDHLEVRALLPDDPAYDFAVNLMTYAPGATLPQVEVHVMEHGLLMLTGAGIYRLGDRWYPVTAGDYLYMAPFCPQWFGALGRTPTTYLIYKDFHR